jgi:hypothetical protein
LCRTEKHEWEESEKVVVMVGMGCLGTDQARETDSGIERLSSAGGRPPGGATGRIFLGIAARWFFFGFIVVF